MIDVLHYILIPFKIILFVILIILDIYILKHTNGDSNITTLIIRFCKFVVHYLMSYNIEISDEDYNKYMRYLYSDEKFLCVFNHVSTLDGFVLLSTFPKMGFVLNYQKVFDYINYDNKINDKIGGIFVDVNKKTSVARKIGKKVNNRKIGDNILFISPTNELPDELYSISFFKKTGAFVNKTKILPILIKYQDNSLINIIGVQSIYSNFAKLFLPENYNIKIKVGNMISADDDESIEEYRDRVYEIMNQQYKDM